MNDQVTQLPSKISFDLDSVERDEAAKDPFVVKVGDREISFTDPSELDWRDVMLMVNPQDLLRLSLSDDDREYLRNYGFPSWKFGKLMGAYAEHFELEKLMQDAERQQALSRQGGF